MRHLKTATVTLRWPLGHGCIGWPCIGLRWYRSSMAHSKSDNDLTSGVTSVDSDEEEEETYTVLFCRKGYLRLIDEHIGMATFKRYEDRVELLKKSSFFITIVPKQTLFGLQYVQTIYAMRLLDPQKFKRMKEVGFEQTMMHLLFLQKYLEELKNRREEMVEMIKTNTDFSIAIQQGIYKHLWDEQELVGDFRNMLTAAPLQITRLCISETSVHHLPPLSLFLSIKGPVMFDQLESTAFDDWAFLSWHVSGQKVLTERFELRFQQLNVPSNEVAHSGVYIVNDSNFKVPDLLPEKTYEFSIRRKEACNLVYDDWHDVLTLSTCEAWWAHPDPKSNTLGDHETQCDSK